MYWKVTPYHNHDADFCVMPGETRLDHRNAFDYAHDRLEAGWDQLKPGQSTTVIIECCDGEMPELDVT